MTRLLIQKSIHESALLWIACGSLLFLFCWARVWIICQFDLEQFRPFLVQLKPFERFVPIPLEQLLTYSGSLSMAYHEPILILCVLVWSIARGSDAVSGEINRGTLEMLLAQPLGRLRWLACNAIVCTAGLALLCASAWIAFAGAIHTLSVRQQVVPTIDIALPLLPWKLPLQVGPSTQMQTSLSTLVEPLQFISPTCNLFGMGFFVLGFSLFCSSCDRYRWRTLGIVIGIFLGQLLLRLLSKATEATSWVANFTFLTAYQPDAIVGFCRHNPARAWWLWVPMESRDFSWPYAVGPLGMTLLLIAGGVCWIALAAWRFKTRDIPAPL